jgi:hypothetical protein
MTEQKKCFVLSQIRKEGSDERSSADKVLRHLIRKALPEFAVMRADDDANPGEITPQIVARILDADLIVADLSGHNPNVLYELAIAHGYQKPTVHLEDKTEKAPFDLKDIRIISYTLDPDDLEAAGKKLSEYAQYALAEPDKVLTPLSSARKFVAVESSEDPVAESVLQVLSAVQDLSRDVKRSLANRRTGITAGSDASSRRTAERKMKQLTADRRALHNIVNRIIDGGRGEPTDFESVISSDTTSTFDD